MGLSYEASLISRYAGVASRLGKPDPQKPRRVVLLAPVEPVDVDPVPEPVRPPVPDYIPALGPLLWKVILQQVSEKHGVAIRDICSAKRDKYITPARYEAAYRMRHEAKMSLPQIGKRLGGRDHTTALHGIRMHEAFLTGRDPDKPIKREWTKPPRFWTEEMRSRAICLRSMGKSNDEIASAIGASSEGAVRNFFQRKSTQDFFRSLGAGEQSAIE